MSDTAVAAMNRLARAMEKTSDDLRLFLVAWDEPETGYAAAVAKHWPERQR